jgi:tetratricopeptide (TPR) repeat protein
VVALADLENRTGEADLDGLGGLFSAALEQSRYLAVVSRSRLLDEARRHGLGEGGRLDEETARQAAQAAGARVLLLPAILRIADTYVLDLRAIEPSGGRSLFSLQERVNFKERLPDTVDGLALQARQALREGQDEVASAHLAVGDAVTRNMEASRHFYQGLDCERTNADSETACPIYFQRALAADPNFALAHHQLAYLMGAEGSDLAGARRENAVAVLAAERVPPRDRSLILAFQAELDGDVERAVASYRAAAERWPEDYEIVARAGYFLHRRRDFSRALPFMRRAVTLDPDQDDTAKLLVQELVQLGRLDELRELAAAQSRLPSTRNRRALLIRCWTWLGAPGKAMLLAREKSDEPGPAARFEEAYLHFNRGDFATAQRLFEADEAAHQGDGYVRLGLIQSRLARGRIRQALEAMPVDDRPERKALIRYTRAAMLAVGGRPEPVWEEARACASTDRLMASGLSADLLLLGDLEHARALATGLEPGSLDDRVWRGLLRWKGGDGRGALRELRALAAAEPVPSWWGLPPAYAAAEVAQDVDDPVAVVESVDRYLGSWHSITARGGRLVPRAILLRAAAEARLGRQATAEVALRALLGQREGGDPGDPVAARIRAVLATLP